MQKNLDIRYVLRDTPTCYDLVGDIHGCWDELVQLLGSAGYDIMDFEPDSAEPIRIRPPDNHMLILLGDLTDRGPRSDLVLRMALGLLEDGTGEITMGNHDWKIARHLHGNKVSLSDEQLETIRQIDQLGEEFRESVHQMLYRLPYQIKLRMPDDHPRAGDGWLTAVHAAAPEHHLDQISKSAFSRSIYGYGEGTGSDGYIIRRDWAADYSGPRWIVHGHEPHAEVRICNRVVALDTGCVFGGKLSMYRSGTDEFVAVPAAMDYSGTGRCLSVRDLEDQSHISGPSF